MGALKAQQLYVDDVSGMMARFDSWQRWPAAAFFLLSNGKFVVACDEHLARMTLRPATDAEQTAFAHAAAVRPRGAAIAAARRDGA